MSVLRGCQGNTGINDGNCPRISFLSCRSLTHERAQPASLQTRPHLSEECCKPHAIYLVEVKLRRDHWMWKTLPPTTLGLLSFTRN